MNYNVTKKLSLFILAIFIIIPVFGAQAQNADEPSGGSSMPPEEPVVEKPPTEEPPTPSPAPEPSSAPGASEAPTPTEATTPITATTTPRAGSTSSPGPTPIPPPRPVPTSPVNPRGPQSPIPVITPPPAPADPSDGDSPINTPLVATLATFIALGAAGIVKLKKKNNEKKNMDPCGGIKTAFYQKKSEADATAYSFSIKQAVLDLLNERIEKEKGKLEGKAKVMAKERLKKALFDVESPRVLKNKIHAAEDKIVASARDVFRGSSDIALDLHSANERGVKNLFTIPDTAIEFFFGSQSGREKLSTHVSGPHVGPLLQEIRKLKETQARGEAMHMAEKIKGTYADLKEKIEKLKEELQALRAKKESLGEEARKLEASYNACVTGAAAVHAGINFTAEKIKIPSFSTKPRRVLVIGPSGSGKTYISGVLKEKGINAFDAEGVDGLLEKNTSRWDKEFLKGFLDKNKEAYLFGTSDNALDVAGMFDEVFFLKVPPQVLRERLGTEQSIPSALDIEEKSARRGITMIDGTKSPEEIFSECLEKREK